MDNTEIELKFRAHKFNKNKFLSFLNEFPILSDSIKNIQNTYFDTDEFLLGRQKAGLRIRKVNKEYIQTLKFITPNNRELIERKEFNCKIDNMKLDFNLFPSGVRKNILNGISDVTCHPIFTTNFKREYWLILLNNKSKIEVAFDNGMVKTNNNQCPISEVEIELIDGDMEDLFFLASKLALFDGLRIDFSSKASIGYQLSKHIIQKNNDDDPNKLPIIDYDSKYRVFKNYFIEMKRHEQTFLDFGHKKSLDAFIKTSQGLKKILELIDLDDLFEEKHCMKNFLSLIDDLNKLYEKTMFNFDNEEKLNEFDLIQFRDLFHTSDYLLFCLAMLEVNVIKD